MDASVLPLKISMIGAIVIFKDHTIEMIDLTIEMKDLTIEMIDLTIQMIDLTIEMIGLKIKILRALRASLTIEIKDSTQGTLTKE